jgi:hypothetical protein
LTRHSDARRPILRPGIGSCLCGTGIQANIYAAKLADGDLPIGNVMVDTRQTLAGLVGNYVLDNSISQQLTNDVVPLHIGIRISCMGDLEGQTGKRETGVFCASSDPESGGSEAHASHPGIPAYNHHLENLVG